MRQTWLIFKKDLRHFWWEILVTVGVLSALTRMDCDRYDFMPGPMEGIFYLLVPAAWSYLIALVIQDEALVGDCQFWVTRPYSRWQLLAAKIAFIIAFVHFPALVSESVVLSAHGFQPLSFLPDLLEKQLLIMSVVTIPSVAIASVTRNVAHFVLTALAVCGSAFVLIGSSGWLTIPWSESNPLRKGIPLAVLVSFAIAIVWLQYSRRRTALARALSVIAALAAAAVFAYLPQEISSELACWTSRGENHPLAIAAAPKSVPVRQEYYPANLRHFEIPVFVSGVPANEGVIFEHIAFRLSNSSGNQWRITPFPKTGLPPNNAVLAFLWASHKGPIASQILMLGPSVYAGTISDAVTFEAKVSAYFTTLSHIEAGKLESGPWKIHGIGRCYASEVNDVNGNMIKVMCESPAGMPATNITLADPLANRHWTQFLGDSMLNVEYPQNTWLSPLTRRQTFFHMEPETARGGDSPYFVPRASVPNLKLIVSPSRTVGCQVVSYRLPNIALREYLIP